MHVPAPLLGSTRMVYLIKPVNHMFVTLHHILYIILYIVGVSETSVAITSLYCIFDLLSGIPDALYISRISGSLYTQVCYMRGETVSQPDP